MYLKYFDFRERPFSVTPDPKFFFDSPVHREAWASLFYGIKEKKGFVVVTGEVGTGKTTLIRKLLRSLEATHHSVFIFNTLLTFDELLETILRDLDIMQAGVGRVAMLERLNEFLLEKIRVGHVVSVLIDEAQNLSEDTLEGLRLLSNMETDREKLLQIILIGQPELDVKLNSRSLRQLKQRISLWCRLNCLSQTETERYIRHRLQIAQYKGTDIFPEAAVRAIWEHTSGIPRLINVVCDNALLTAFATSKKIVSVDMVEEVVRDLRIESDSHRFGSAAPEHRDLTQAARASARDMTTRVDQEHPGRVSYATAPAVAQVLPNVPDWVKRDEIPLPDLGELKRHQLRPVAIVAEFKEKKSGENARVAEINETSRTSRSVFSKPEAVTEQPRKFERGDKTLLSPQFVDKVVAALTEAMGPMAPFVIKAQAAALGESLERFPVTRLRDLMQRIKSEILCDALRGAFEKQIAIEIARHGMSLGWRNSAG